MRRAVRSLVLLALVTSTACAKEKRREPEAAAVDPNAPISAGGGPIEDPATPVTPDPQAGEASTGEPEPGEAAATPPAEPAPTEVKPVDSRPARPTRATPTPRSTDSSAPRGDQAEPADDGAVEPGTSPGSEEPAASDRIDPDRASPNGAHKPRKPRSAGSANPAQGQPCADGHCAPGLRCIEYYGIAGPRGPAFTSCEIPCPGGKGCPAGQHCTTISDGPGQVCRPGS